MLILNFFRLILVKPDVFSARETCRDSHVLEKSSSLESLKVTYCSYLNSINVIMSKIENNVEKSFYLKNIRVNKIQANLNSKNDMVLKIL